MNPIRIPRRRVDGVLLLDKPAGISSNAALQRAKRALNAQKAGHTGTLDPLASGLLPLCFGEATKFAQTLLDAGKRYTATVRFGATTATGDAEGPVTATFPVTFTDVELHAALRGFEGVQEQIPPAYSALKFEGRAHYEYARAGVAVPRPPRQITIHALRLVSWQPPDAVLEVECSKGTYIRVLAEDLGHALGSGAHLAALRRTATGGFALAEAIALPDFEAAAPDARDRVLLPVSVLVATMVRLSVEGAAGAAFRQGQTVDGARLEDGPCAVFCGTELLGIADVVGGRAQPRRVIPGPDVKDAQPT
ncbi:MAG: tRNA pseudouridine(55) synthase TruB [Betaproteobacteria bacterium]